MAKGFEIKGMRELEQTMKKLEMVPQKVVTRAAKAGTSIALKAARALAPVDSGELRDGIIMKKERRAKPAKAVYDVMMDPAKNDIFAKIHADGETRSYYPASQEYGFMTADGGFVPGHHFLRNSLTENKESIEQKIVEVAGKEVDKVLKGG